MQNNERAIKAPTWIYWIGATAVAAATMSAFSFQTFETREDAKQDRDGLERRLDRIESKLDKVIESK